MSADLTCFADIIGFSRTQCDCADIDNYTFSKSGLYLDELEGVNLRALNSLTDSDKGTLTGRFGINYENAVNYLKNDINVEAYKHFQPRYPAYNGLIGLAKKDATYTGLSQTYAYVRFLCRPMVGAKMIIKKIATLFELTGTKTLWVYNSLNELKGTYTLDTLANTYKENNIADLELDLYDDRLEEVEYYFVYEVAANRPKNNALNCTTCGSTYHFNRLDPCWKYPHKKYGWANFVCVASGQTNALDFETVSQQSISGCGTYMLGLMFDVEIKCDFQQALCSQDYDFATDTIGVGIATALRYKTGSMMLHDLSASGEVNRYTMIDGDATLANIELYDAKYKELVSWLGENIDLTKMDCWMCKDYHGFQKNYIAI